MKAQMKLLPKWIVHVTQYLFKSTIKAKQFFRLNEIKGLKREEQDKYVRDYYKISVLK